MLAACQGGSSAGGGGAGNAGGAGGSQGQATGAPFNAPESVLMPVVSDDAPSIDTAHVAEGYVVARASSPARLKFQVACGDAVYNYDLPSDGTPMVYPMNMGDGEYKFRVMQNTSGSNYVELESETAAVALDSPFSPFLTANMFCSYDPSSACVGKAREVTASAENVGQVVQSVCEFVAGAITYDNDKAEVLAATTGYVPNPDETLASGRGVCFDYASLATAMLRSLGIPTKIVTGYVGEQQVYHAWIMVYIDGTWHSALFKVDPNTWSRCDVTFASAGTSQYVGDASAYTDLYTY